MAPFTEFSGQGALFHAMNAVLDPGDKCVIIDPYYTPYPGTVRAAGGACREGPGSEVSDVTPRT